MEEASWPYHLTAKLSTYRLVGDVCFPWAHEPFARERLRSTGVAEPCWLVRLVSLHLPIAGTQSDRV